MGGTQSNHSNLTPQIINSKHSQFQKVRIISTTNDKYLQAEFAIGNSKDILSWKQKVKPLKDNQCLFLPLDHQIQHKFVCGDGGICRTKYPFYDHLLSDCISKMKKEQRHYSTKKIWYFLYQLCEAAHIFHNRGVKIGDVRPINIFLNIAQNVKIGNRFSWPRQNTNYEKSIFDKEFTYLAPQEIRQLSFGHNQPQTNFQLAESFSVGLTLLDCAVLTDSTDLYDINLSRFDYQKLEERMKDLWKIKQIDYILKQIIGGLCKPDPAARINCRLIYDWLKKYKENIMNSGQLHFQQIPSFIPPQMKENKNLYVESQVVSQFPSKFTKFQPAQSYYVPKHQQIPIEAKKTQQKNEIEDQLKQISNIRNQNLLNHDDFNLTLKKIQQQLERSRKMFPS